MNNNNLDNEFTTKLKVDHNDHVTPDRSDEIETIRKTARLAKLNFLMTIVGLGTLGYLHFANQNSIDQSLAKTKQEISKDLASKEDLHALSTDLATKMEGQATRISGLEVQGERFQEELHKTDQLSAKLNELQSSMKRAKPAAVAPVSKTKSKAKPKPAVKAVKKSRR